MADSGKQTFKKSDKIKLIISIVTLGLAALIVYFDKDYKYKWIAFALWNISLLSGLCLVNAVENGSFWQRLKSMLSELRIYLKTNPLVSILIFLSLSRLIFLTTYPYVGSGDATRDGGTRAQEIASGVWEDIFGYDWSQGVTLATYLSPLYLFFESNLILYRLPAAIVSLIDIALLYYLVKLTANKTAAFFAALALICCCYHWYFGRMEVLIEFSSLFTTLIFLRLYYLQKNFSLAGVFLTGMLLGFSFSFHASIWFVCIFSVLLTAGIIFTKSNRQLQVLAVALCLLGAGILVGYGPRILNAYNFFISYAKRFAPKPDAEMVSLWDLYLDNLKVYFLDPGGGGHFPGFTYFSYAAGLVLVLGGIYALLFGNLIKRFALFIVLLIPFLNCALAACVGAEYRVFPVLAAGSILIGLGASWLLDVCNSKHILLRTIQVLFWMFFFTEQVYGLGQFFLDRRASNPFNRQAIYFEYMMTDAAYLIRENYNTDLYHEICFMTDAQDSENFKLMHLSEYLSYFLPQKRFDIKVVESEPQKTWSIFPGPCIAEVKRIQWETHKFCENGEFFSCPPDGSSYQLRLAKIAYHPLMHISD